MKRAFQPSWFKSWNWLHYDEATDASFCYYCGKAEQEGKLKATNKDVAFIAKDFTIGKMLLTVFVVTSKANVT